MSKFAVVVTCPARASVAIGRGIICSSGIDLANLDHRPTPTPRYHTSIIRRVAILCHFQPLDVTGIYLCQLRLTDPITAQRRAVARQMEDNSTSLIASSEMSLQRNELYVRVFHFGQM